MNDHPCYELHDDVVIKDVGEVLLEWALDPSCMPPPAEIKERLAKAGLVFQPNIERVHIHTHTENEVHLMLPRPEQVKRVMDRIKAGHRYNLPHTMRHFWERPEYFDTPEKRLDFFTFRFGDYTLQHCGGD